MPTSVPRITLRRWVVRYAIIPLVLAFSVVLIVGVFSAIYVARMSWRQQDSTLLQVQNSVRFGLQQHNRGLVENALETGRIAIDAKSIQICQGSHLVYASGATSAICIPALERAIPIEGYEGYFLQVEPRGTPLGPVQIGTALGLLFLVGSGLILVQIVSRFNRSLISPIEEGLGGLKESVAILELEQLKKMIEERTQLQVVSAVADAIVVSSRQVAHDIRSPLAALSVAEASTKDLPEDTRLLMRSAIARIRDIANNLLTQNKPKSEQSTEASAKLTLVWPAIESIVSEKRAEFKSASSLHLDFITTGDPRLTFTAAMCDQAGLARVISNLINNSVEAVDERGNVIVELKQSPNAQSLLISVTDDGPGIAPELLRTLGSRGVSHGKSDGHGLGLAHAKDYAAAQGGELAINSPVTADKRGTRVTLSLPITQAPVWLADRIDLKGAKRLVIVDDDRSVHSAWDLRLRPFKTIEVLHFESVAAFENAADTLVSSHEGLYLIDYDLKDKGQTGLDLIEHYGLAPRAILTTSYYNDEAIQSRALRLGLKILPKSMVGRVEIQLG